MSTVTMPRLSDSMKEGTVVRWLKADGDAVEPGDELVEIETDKATMTYEAEAAGVLRRLVAEGESVPLAAPIAELLAADGNGRAAPSLSSPPTARRIAASPVARRVAAELGIDLAALNGTGPRGRVVKRDVEARAAAPAHAGAPSAAAPRGAVEAIALSHVQTLIARRMVESRASVPDFSLEVDVAPRELSGATFTVSNLGMFGITRFTAVIDQPQAAILAVGALQQRPIVRDGLVVAAHVMTLTLCPDHRILYGADAAAFLSTVRAALEAPLRLLL